MKTKISRIGKKSLSVVIALMMIVSTMLVGMVSVSAATVTATVYIDCTNQSDLGSSTKIPNIYAWYGDSTKMTDAWPGKAMTRVSDTVFKYEFTFDTDTVDTDNNTVKVIFNNGSTQTSNIELKNSQNAGSDWITTSKIFTVDSNLTNKNYTGTWSTYSGGSGETTGNYYYAYWDANATINKFVQMDKDAKNEGSYIIRVSTNNSSYAPLTNSNQFKISNAQSTNADEANKILSESGAKSVNWSTGFSTDRVSKSDSLTGVTFSVDEKYHDLKIGNIGSNTDFYIQYTPSGTSGLDGNIKVWSVSDYDGSTEPTTPTPTTKYYLGGRITGDNNGTWITQGETTYPFEATETAGVYKYVSNQTPAVWSENRGGNPQYFYVLTGKDKPWYGTSGTTVKLSSSGQSVDLTSKSYKTTTEVKYLTYIDSKDTTGNVIFYLDTNNGMKLYYEVEGGSTTKGAFEIKDKTAVNGSLSFSAEGKTAGTADAGNTVNVKAKPYAGFTCSGITVSYTNKTTSETVTLASTGSGNSYTFVVPEELTTAITESISVAATFTLDKSAYIATQGDGLWIDVAPNENDSTATLIKWNNYSGSNHETTSTYIFYVPKNVDLTNANIYNGYGSAVNLNGTSIPADNKAVVSLTKDTTYTTSGGVSASVKAMQGSTNAMFLYTTKGDAAYSLPTKTGAGGTKDSVKSDGGSCKTMTDTTDTAKQFSAAMALDSVKGRGNSSWEASNKLFGKYAFNMKLAKKTNLFNIDTTKLPDGSKPSGSKSWCLLANNADESMLRNALTYQLASEIGLLYSPEFSFVDIYDNGEYLGSYLVTEKVDVGNSKLVKGTSFEDLNEEGAKAEGATKVKEDTVKSTYTYGGSNYSMQYAKVSPNDVTSDSAKYPSETKGKYLLEFELKKRLLPPDGDERRTASEASWFRSPRGQYVVVKSPEFATKEQVEFIAKKFAKMEEVAFTANASKSDLSTVMDVESFAKMYLIQEFSSNLDSAATSYYMTFDCAQTNPVFVANPVWDYDWAYGQYENKVKKDVNGTLLDSANPKAWFAKAKQIGDNEADSNNKYSIQSQLASNSDSFKSVVRKVWEQENGFYDNIKKYYGDNSQIDAWYNQIKDSVDMNETRWGFIASDPLKNISTGSWGSKNTGANHAEAVNYLENTWTKVRAEEFLNTESGLLNSEYAPYTPAKPAISAYNADLSATITSPINSGTDFVIKVTSDIESGVKYRLYEGSSSAYLYENKDGVFALKATEAGTKTYTVKAVFGENESSASDSVEVTVVALDITDVTLKSSNSSVKPGDKFTLTATAVPSDLSDVTYKFYQSSDSTVSTDTDKRLVSNGNTATVTADTTPGNYYYYVVAKDANNVEITSSIVTVKVTNEGAVINNVKIRFKGTTLSSLIPYMSVDGEAATVMSRSTANPIGTHLSGAYRFVWFEATIPTVTVGQGKTLTFTTNNSKESTMDASITLDFTTCDAENVIYLAVDNLMSGTTAVDITNNETAKTSFGSAMNMIKQSSASDPVATTLLSTMLKVTSASGQVKTKRYYLGDLDSDNTIGIKDATEIQKSITGSSELDAEYQSLGDFNADGVVDIKDATAIQKYIAGF